MTLKKSALQLGAITAIVAPMAITAAQSFDHPNVGETDAKVVGWYGASEEKLGEIYHLPAGTTFLDPNALTSIVDIGKIHTLSETDLATGKTTTIRYQLPER